MIGPRGVAVPGDEDDRDVVAAREEVVMETGPALAGHAEVEEQAKRNERIVAWQEVARRGEGLHAVPGRAKEPLQPAADRDVVVDDDDGVVLHCGCPSARGKVKWKAAPQPPLLDAHMVP